MGITSRIEIDATDLRIATDPDGFRIEAYEDDIHVKIRMTAVTAGVMRVKLGELLGIPKRSEDIAQLKDTLSECRNANDRGTADLGEANAKAKDLRAKLNARCSELDRLKESVTEHRTACGVGRMGITRRDADIRQLESQYLALEKSATAREDDLLETIGGLKAEIVRLRKVIDACFGQSETD